MFAEVDKCIQIQEDFFHLQKEEIDKLNRETEQMMANITEINKENVKNKPKLTQFEEKMSNLNFKIAEAVKEIERENQEIERVNIELVRNKAKEQGVQEELEIMRCEMVKWKILKIRGDKKPRKVD